MTLHQKIDAMIINKPNRFILHTQNQMGQREREFSNALDLLAAAKSFAATALYTGEPVSPWDMMYVQAGSKKWTWTPSDQNTLRGMDGTPNFLIWRAA